MRRFFLKAQFGNKVCSFVLVLVLVSLLCFSSVGAQDEYFSREFSWTYKGYDWTFSLDISKSLYEAYRSVSVPTRTRNGPAGYGFLTTTNDYCLKQIADKLQEAASEEEYESYDEVSFVLAFVQSLPYTSDSVTSGYDEYPRFPVETLVDNGGDCEDTSILFATITLIMGYGTVYISPPEHLAVGVLGDGLHGFYYVFDDRTYYYCETTGDGWKIGDIPSEYEDEKASLYEIYEGQQYVADLWISPTPDVSATPSPSLISTLDAAEFRLMLWAVVPAASVLGGILVYGRRRVSLKGTGGESTVESSRKAAQWFAAGVLAFILCLVAYFGMLFGFWLPTEGLFLVLILFGNPFLLVFFGVCGFVFVVLGYFESWKGGAARIEKDVRPSQPFEDLRRLKELKDFGAISQEEYDEKKKKILERI